MISNKRHRTLILVSLPLLACIIAYVLLSESQKDAKWYFDQITIGMSTDQVESICGRPVLEQSFAIPHDVDKGVMARRLYWGKMKKDIMLDVDRFYVELNNEGTVIRKEFNQGNGAK